MVYLLIALSFILHLLIIFAIIVLFQRKSLERVNLPTLQEDVETIHESIEAFVNEVEKENERLYEQMDSSIRQQADEWKKRAKVLDERLQQLEERVQLLEQRPSGITDEGKLAHRAVQPPEQQGTAYVATAEDEALNRPARPMPGQGDVQEDQSVAGRDEQQQKFQRVVALYKQGFSIDDIARLLNIGKGEAMLLVNLLDKQK